MLNRISLTWELWRRDPIDLILLLHAYGWTRCIHGFQSQNMLAGYKYTHPSRACISRLLVALYQIEVSKDVLRNIETSHSSWAQRRWQPASAGHGQAARCNAWACPRQDEMRSPLIYQGSYAIFNNIWLICVVVESFQFIGSPIIMLAFFYQHRLQCWHTHTHTTT